MKTLHASLLLTTALLLAGSAFAQLVPGDRPIAPAPGGGFYTQNCQMLCNAAGVSCGPVVKDARSYCCCIGSCPNAAGMCAILVNQCLPPPGP